VRPAGHKKLTAESSAASSLALVGVADGWLRRTVDLDTGISDGAAQKPWTPAQLLSHAQVPWGSGEKPRGVGKKDDHTDTVTPPGGLMGHVKTNGSHLTQKLDPIINVAAPQMKLAHAAPSIDG